MVKKATYFIVAVLFFSGLFWLLSQPPKNNSNQSGNTVNIDYSIYNNTDLVLFYSTSCPHCQNVEKWLQENNSDNKLKITSKEISDSSNHDEMVNLVKQTCPEIIGKNGDIGIPTAFDPANKKCLQGDTPIIDFLSAKLKK
jgi:glutaredoxin-related protein